MRRSKPLQGLLQLNTWWRACCCSIKWYKGESVVVNDEHHTVSVRGRLTIRRAGPHSEAIYSCRASNQWGSALSTYTHLRMAGELLHQAVPA